MMKLKVFSILLFLSITVFGQDKTRIMVLVDDKSFDYQDDQTLNIYNSKSGLIGSEKIGVTFEVQINKYPTTLYFYLDGLPLEEIVINEISKEIITVLLGSAEQLNEVVIKAQEKKVFNLNRLSDFEGTSIYAGKKTEVIQVSQIPANLASNNARQIYAQISGLNIYQNDDAGLQLNIGGRGLDPNRTSNFNTRQNGYDISADVLGYPESYYSPPAELIKEIQIVRGAASLQYGTQFGGLVNFKLKEPSFNKELDLKTRNTIGSNNLYTNYTELSGTKKNLSYLASFNFKSGDGFRPNSEFNSRNYFFQLNYKLNDKTNIKAEFTFLDYLAQQAGGLSDDMFNESPFQSNRSRNWFNINWLLFQTKIKHSFSDKSKLDVQLFGLNAQRDALGYRTNRVSAVDPNSYRDLISGNFKNYGIETKWLNELNVFGKKIILLLGSKWYSAQNSSNQGPGSNGYGPDFKFYNQENPNYSYQSNYIYPNKNLAFFSEQIFYLNKKISITPGVRYEHINTKAIGDYKKINLDGAGNVIQNQTLLENQQNKRSFFLFGVGLNYKFNDNLELYLNTSQNYRSVTFADISTFNPAYSINPNIKDENGISSDIGLKGRFKDYLSLDLSLFNLLYNDRIGFTQRAYKDGSVKSERGNVGDAEIIGFESIVEFNLDKLIFERNKKIEISFFFNLSSINSEYVNSETPGVIGKKVEFIPSQNYKLGGRVGYKNLFLSLQLTKLGDQFTDASNATLSNLSGVIGKIPGYQVIDLVMNYKTGKFKIETGINNLGNEIYFTRRATGYPGPGIIPSPPRNYYMTLQYRL